MFINKKKNKKIENQKTKKILEEIEKILLTESCVDPNLISLNHITSLIRQKNNEYKKIKEDYQIILENIIKSNIDQKYSLIIYDLYFNKEELVIGIKRNEKSDWEKISIKKNNNELYISWTTSYLGNIILEHLKTQLIELFNKIIEFQNFNTENKNILALNTEFQIQINNYGVNLYKSEFSVRSRNYEHEYEYDYKDKELLELLSGKEDEIYKRVFVKITDCPYWMQETLTDIREKELKENNEIKIKKRYFWQKNRNN